MAVSPDKLKVSDADQRKLYDLIWKRTIAGQMEAARLERTTVEIGSRDGQVGLRATGQVVLFDGFLKVYEEGRDDVVDDDDKRLPQLSEGDAMDKRAITPEQHFTQPPPRYTEATLVKKMEELGIGRPSTYASIVTTIQDRGYVIKDKNRLMPEDKGRLVTIFLVNYFKRYLEYDFTADLERQLDDISAGEADYKEVLDQFWRDFSAAIAETSELRITEVLDKIDEVLAPHLYPPTRRWQRPAPMPQLRQRAVVDAHRAVRRGVHRVQQLSRMPLHPPLRPPRPRGQANAIPPDGKLLGEMRATRSACARAGSAPMCSAVR